MFGYIRALEDESVREKVHETRPNTMYPDEKHERNEGGE
jgi:hypothetical protein